MKKFIQDFKAFAMKGNVIDMAIGVIIGGAFSKIVTSLVNDVIMPFFSLFTDSVEFSGLKLVLRQQVTDDAGTVLHPEVAIAYGAFLQNVVDFLLIALSIFLFIRLMTKLGEKLRRKQAAEEKKEEEKPKAPTQEELLTQIRDLLAGQYGVEETSSQEEKSDS